MTDKDNPRLETDPATAELMERILYEVKRVVVGQDRFLERVMVALLAGGHLLVEGVPGLAKTLTVKTLASVLQGQFKRIQFTPDLVPADLIGTRIYNQKTGDFITALRVDRGHALDPERFDAIVGWIVAQARGASTTH